MPALKFVEYDPDRYTPLLTLEESTNPLIKIGLQNAIDAWDVDHTDLLEHFTDLNKNYRGRFHDPDAGLTDPLTGVFKEAFVDMRPLENAPSGWWSDNFGPRRAPVEVVRVRVEAVGRWRAIGSIFRAWCPAEFHAFTNFDNENNAPR